MADYTHFVFDEIRTIGQAWRAANPGAPNDPEFWFEKIGDMSWRRLVDNKSVRQILVEIGVNPDDYLPPLPPSAYPFPDEAGRLHIEGTTFRTESNHLWQWRGYSWFLGYRRFLAGEDVTADLRWLRSHGVNIVRVFGPLPWRETPDYRAETFNTDRLSAFFTLLAEHGLRVEFVPVCYGRVSDPAVREFTLDAQRALVQRVYDVAQHHWNVLIECANEPHVNQTDPVAILKNVDRRGVLTAYGLYGKYYDNATGVDPVVDYGTIHVLRDSSWHRKARHTQELQHATHVPTVSDEPAKITEPDFHYPGGKNDPARTPAEMVWHGAITHLWTPGFTLHTEEGKWGRVPTPGMLQSAVADAVLEQVWKRIGPEWQTGGYMGSHLGASPVDHIPDIWTYTSLHDATALSVRCATSAPQPKPGWVEVDRWGPGGSLVSLKRAS